MMIYFHFQTARWSALLVGIIYGKRRYDNLKPIAEEERRIEEEEKKVREEQERIAKQLAEANEDTILKWAAQNEVSIIIDSCLDKGRCL